MSDCGRGSSLDDNSKLGEKDEEATTKTTVNPVRKFCFFLTETGHSLNFVVLLADNSTDSDVTQLKERIHSHMGTVSTSKKDVGSHSAVLVPDEAASWDYIGDVFRLSYIDDCIAAGKLLNIAPYLKNPPSKLLVENFDYMSVIHHRKYSWETIPPMYKLPKPKPAEIRREPLRGDPNDSDSSFDSFRSLSSAYSSTHHRDRKHTKSAYMREEKEAMLRYVVERKMYSRVKGKQIYRDMEAANICPIRTWQSMKDHFLKSMSKNLNQFSFLTESQKTQLKNALHPY